MDTVLVDYLMSGEAWLMVGSGPSNAMQYPSWKSLASTAIETAKIEALGMDLKVAEKAFKKEDYPLVFEEVQKILGMLRTIQVLHDTCISSGSSDIYEIITRWPVPVYMTTNYDNEIQNHLAKVQTPYQEYSNSEYHMAHLLTGFEGGIFKLHGDLRSEEGLVLTTSQYQSIESGPEWEYWRTKMTSIFQMAKVVIIGHSLSDPNIRHVLEAAKKGAGIERPICWIAPNVAQKTVKEFLEKYRIRVIPYDNSDGSHQNLVKLIKNIDDFIPSRLSIEIGQQIAQVTESKLGSDAAAPGFFVFNKLFAQEDYDQKRIEVIGAAIKAALPNLHQQEPFTLKQALELAGWPIDHPISSDVSEDVIRYLIEEKTFTKEGDNTFNIAEGAVEIGTDSKQQFEDLRKRFKHSLVLRIKKDYPRISVQDSTDMASYIEASLTGYFREGGLTLVTTLFSEQNGPNTVPSSIIRFISEASAKYDSHLKRQAFITTSMDAFIHPSQSDKSYLGKIAQGFCGFHMLGVFGDAAIERLKQAKETVWLVDSNAQISALALGSSTNELFSECFSRLKGIGIRLFTTENLFDETYGHFLFADGLIQQFDSGHHYIIAAAMGEPPYRKSNQFLEGFVKWQASGNPQDWEKYLFEALGHRRPTKDNIRLALGERGIEVIPFEEWLGFEQEEFSLKEEYINKITDITDDSSSGDYEPLQALSEESVVTNTSYKKAQPEAEAMIVINKERSGSFYILSDIGEESPAWFISDTSLLNIVDTENNSKRITWQTESFLRFSSTMCPTSSDRDIDRAFQTILWGCAQSGLSLLDDDIVQKVFGGIINQAKTSVRESRLLYQETLSNKYGDHPEDVLSRIKVRNRPLAAIQMANEVAESQKKRADEAVVEKSRAEKEKKAALKIVSEVENFKEFKNYKQKKELRQKKEKRKKRNLASRKKKKKGKKRKK